MPSAVLRFTVASASAMWCLQRSSEFAHCVRRNGEGAVDRRIRHATTRVFEGTKQGSHLGQNLHTTVVNHGAQKVLP